MSSDVPATISTMKRAMLLLAMMLAGVGAVWPSAVAAAPSCSTFDDANHPAANFAAGDKIIVRGTGFAPNELVLVSFQQGRRTADIAHLKTNDLGAFGTDPSGSRLPSSVERGPATIQVFQGAGAASCDVRLVSAKASRPGGLGRGFYLTWGIALTICAIGLAFATIRRWQAERLSQEMDSIEWSGPEPDAYEDEPRFDIDELDDDRPVLEDDEPRLQRPEPERVELDEPIPAVPGGTSDAVAQLRRDVRAWKSR